MIMNFRHHLDLLLRWERGLSLREAIYDVVESDSSVLDAGCGSGLLSFWAAQAGAKRVVGVDTGELGLAQALAVENKLEKKITFIQSGLLADKLAETIGKFDVVLGMLYYNDPRRDEVQSQLTFEVHKRFLADSGVRIPDRVEYTGYACDWAVQDITNYHRDLRESVEVLEGRYGLKFDAVYDEAISRPHPNWFPQRMTSGILEREDARMLSEATAFTTIDYTKSFKGYPENVSFEIITPGVLTAVIWVQRLYYKDQLIFSNESISWIGDAKRIDKGDQITVLIDDYWRKSNILTIE